MIVSRYIVGTGEGDYIFWEDYKILIIEEL